MHRYRPFTVDALLDLAKYDAAEHQKATYSADILWTIARYVSRGQFEANAPSEFAMELDGGARAKKDERTGQQIIDELGEKLKSL